jgi:hypothetical protein
MGVGILTSRTQANALMADAVARNAGGCGKCPPAGGVTGARPATGDTSDNPSPRQDALHPRVPQGVIARQTGNNPCGGNTNSSQNTEQQGHTGNPNDQNPDLSMLSTQPVSPYQPNPLMNPSGSRRAPATDGMGQPTVQAISDTDCPPCAAMEAASPYSSDNPDYAQGYAAGQTYGPSGYAERGPATAAQLGSSPDYAQGFNEGAQGMPFAPDRRRPGSLYNTRRGARTNVRRGVARYF